MTPILVSMNWRNLELGMYISFMQHSLVLIGDINIAQYTSKVSHIFAIFEYVILVWGTIPSSFLAQFSSAYS